MYPLSPDSTDSGAQERGHELDDAATKTPTPRTTHTPPGTPRYTQTRLKKIMFVASLCTSWLPPSFTSQVSHKGQDLCVVVCVLCVVCVCRCVVVDVLLVVVVECCVLLCCCCVSLCCCRWFGCVVVLSLCVLLFWLLCVVCCVLCVMCCFGKGFTRWVCMSTEHHDAASVPLGLIQLGQCLCTDPYSSSPCQLRATPAKKS